MANVITVNALNRYVKSVLESDEVLSDVAVRGEISGFVHHQKSGHLYFYLKDETASVKAVMFRSSAQALGFEPQNGMRVVARCRASLYERDGAFQLYVDALFPDGVGAAQQAYEQLKQKLFAEGLFDSARKRTLPAYPSKVGLITSKNGAALADILQISARRYPLVTYLFYPVNVQGVLAEPEITNALRTLGARDDLDAIIVARGGGSKEDLWVFNSEAIARAAVQCRAPVVSAVGHEIDFTILDFVADLRVPTPSAAAELVLPDRADLLSSLDAALYSAAQMTKQQLSYSRKRLALTADSAVLQVLPARLHEKEQALQSFEKVLSHTVMQKTSILAARLSGAAQLAETLDPHRIFKRGFAAVFCEKQQVFSANELAAGTQIALQMDGGNALCRVTQVDLQGEQT